MDGMRGYWNGQQMISRQGNRISCPEWFVEQLPKGMALDGELWLGRRKFESIQSVINCSKGEASMWKQIKYIIFDLPGSHDSYESRMEILRRTPLPSFAFPIQIEKCKGNQHLLEKLEVIVEQGGEGLMVTKPGSVYTKARVSTLLKIKVHISILS